MLFVDLSLPNRSDPEILSLIGILNNFAIQIKGMPSAKHRSLSNTDSRKSPLRRLVTKKFTFGVEIRNGNAFPAATSINCSKVGKSIASNGSPKRPNTFRDRSSTFLMSAGPEHPVSGLNIDGSARLCGIEFE